MSVVNRQTYRSASDAYLARHQWLSVCDSHLCVAILRSVRGIKMGYPQASTLRICTVKIAFCPTLPIRGIAFLMGNNIAGGKVIPALEVSDSPQRTETVKCNTATF